jgi:thiamine-phosphate pyrophosphorylase
MIPFNLYLVTDRSIVRGDLQEAVRQALEGGVRAVQLREKDLPVRDLIALAIGLRTLTWKFGALLFINDRVDVAMATEADGVHLGQNSLPVDAVRQVTGSSLLIGASTHSLKEAEEAEKSGADFLTVGPVFDTPSKRMYGPPLGPALLGRMVQQVRLPVFAIGGITPQHVVHIATLGISGVAVISSILGAPSVLEGAKKMALELQKFKVGNVDPPRVQ